MALRLCLSGSSTADAVQMPPVDDLLNSRLLRPAGMQQVHAVGMHLCYKLEAVDKGLALGSASLLQLKQVLRPDWDAALLLVAHGHRVCGLQGWLKPLLQASVSSQLAAPPCAGRHAAQQPAEWLADHSRLL